MTTPTATGDPIPAKWRRYRVGIVAVGLLLFAGSLIGAWLSLPPASVRIPDAGPATASPRPFVFIPHASPRPVANVGFEDGDGRKRTLADFRGKVVLLNIWATWCVPCRKEMPTLDRLQSKLGSKDFEVVALSIDRGGRAVVKSFYDEINIRSLALYVDATTEAGDKLGVVGVPTTLLLDREGLEVGRVTGAAEWDSAAVVDVIARYLPPRER